MCVDLCVVFCIVCCVCLLLVAYVVHFGYLDYDVVCDVAFRLYCFVRVFICVSVVLCAL